MIVNNTRKYWSPTYDQTVIRMVEGGKRTADIARAIGVSADAVTKNIRRLKDAGRIQATSHEAIEIKRVASGRERSFALPVLAGREWIWDDAARCYRARRIG